MAGPRGRGEGAKPPPPAPHPSAAPTDERFRDWGESQEKGRTLILWLKGKRAGKYLARHQGQGTHHRRLRTKSRVAYRHGAAIGSQTEALDAPFKHIPDELAVGLIPLLAQVNELRIKHVDHIHQGAGKVIAVLSTSI